MKREKEAAPRIGAVGLATAYVGSLVGAGFASGQELLQFFCVFGWSGLWGTLVMGGGFTVLGLISMLCAMRMDSPDYDDVMAPKNSRYYKKFINTFSLFFLFGVLVVMLASAGSLLAQQFHIPVFVGSFLLAVLTVLMVSRGGEGLLKILSAVVPVMVVMAVAISAAVALRPVGIPAEQAITPAGGLTHHWALSALLYVSYNMLSGVALMVPLGHRAKSERAIAAGALLAGAALFAMGGSVCVAMLRNYDLASSVDIPTVALAQALSPMAGTLYVFVIFMGTFTASASILYSINAHIDTAFPGFKISRKRRTALMTAAAFIGSHIGFTELVGTLYPIAGYVGFLFLGTLSCNFIYAARKTVRPCSDADSK